MGHGSWRRAVRARLRTPVVARRGPSHRAATHGRAAERRAADLRVRDRALPAARRRSDHQALARLYRLPGGERAALCGDAAAGRVRVRQRRRPAQLDRRRAGDRGRRAARAARQGGRPEHPRSRLLPRSLRLPPGARRLRARPQQRPRRRSPQPAARLADRRDAGARPHGADARRRAARRFPRDWRLRVRRTGAAAVTRVDDGSPARLRSYRGARRSHCRRPLRRRGRGVLARPGHLLLRPLHFRGCGDRRAGARA